MKKDFTPKKSRIIQTTSGYNKNISRRDFLAIGSATGLGITACESEHSAKNANDTPEISFGLVADLHYADKETWSARFYRESDDKLRECINIFNSLNPEFIVELGDIIDKAEKEIELDYLSTIDSIFAEFEGECHYVLGNHDVATFSKEEFIGNSGASKNFYAFDHDTCHFVVLDANYNSDGSDYNAGNFNWKETYIPEPEQKWLRHELELAQSEKVIVFIHQNLHNESDPHGVKNAPEVRSILEEAGNVMAVFQGHMHSGGYAEINGIHYVTLRAAVEGASLDNNAFAMVYVYADGTIRVEGYKKQASYKLQSKS